MWRSYTEALAILRYFLDNMGLDKASSHPIWKTYGHPAHEKTQKNQLLNSDTRNCAHMSKFLTGTKIAILAANGFEQNDFTQSQRALLAAGATIKVICPDQGLVNGWEGSSWGHHFAVDQTLATALGADFDMLVVPGGERSLNKLKTTAHTKRFIGSVMNAGKPIVMFNDAAILLEHNGLAQEADNLFKAVTTSAEEHTAAVAAMVEFFGGFVADVKQAA